MRGDLESTSLVQRIVLCGLLDLEASDATPANTAEVREAVSEQLSDVDSGTVGRITETEVIRVLNGLGGTALVDERRPDDRSPVGKSRPVYRLSIEPVALREALADDERVEALLA